MSTFNAAEYLKTGRGLGPSSTLIEQSLFKTKLEGDSMRRGEAARRVSAYKDDLAGIVSARLRNQFEEENYREIVKVLDTSNNVLKRIIDDISLVYSKPASWKFEIEVPQWVEALRTSEAPVFFPELNRMVNLCNEAGVMVAPWEESLKFHLITPNDLIVWQDPEDPTKPIAYAYRQGMVNTSEAKPRWHYWSRYEDVEKGILPAHRIVEGDDFYKGAIVSEEENPYRDDKGRSVLNFVLYHRARPVGSLFDQTSGNDIMEAAILLCCLETFVNHLTRTDAAKVKYIFGQLSAKGVQVAGTTRLLSFTPIDGVAPTIGQFDSNSNLSDIGAQLVRKLQNVLNNNGMSMADFQMTGDAQSGFALQVRKSGLMERRERQIPLYECYDRELYKTACAVWNFEIHNTESDVKGPEMPWPDQARPAIHYAEYQTTQTVEERTAALALLKERMTLGLTNIVEAYMAEHPDVSEAEAREAIEKNKAEAKAFSPPQQPLVSPARAFLESAAQRLKAQQEQKPVEKTEKPEDKQPTDSEKAR